MRGALLAAGAVVLLGFAGCGGDEFSESAQTAGNGGQAGQAGSSGAGGQAGGAGASGQAGAAGQGGAAPSAEEACQQYASAYCDRLEACASALVDILYGDVATCIERYKPVCVEGLALPGTTKNAAFASTCATALKAYSCDFLLARHIPDDCVPAPGPRKEGEACGEEGQCATGYCKYETSEGCGACRNRASADGICDVDTDCEQGLLCAKERCAPYGELDAVCDVTLPCRPGLSCVGAISGKQGQCQRARVGGELCDANAAVRPNCDLLQGLYCNASGVCQKALLAKDGEPCGVVTGGLAICTASAKCDPGALSGTCTPAAADGEPCHVEEGPYCMPLSQCIQGQCTPPALSSCQ